MLEILRIKNLAVINEAEISFQKGLNILSGETGAGKSIIIDAISLLLGSRASLDLIRTGCDEALVEGVFQIEDAPWVQKKLIKHGFQSDQSTQTKELIIKRSVHRMGKNRITLNGELASLSVLQEVAEGLIDLCGQHEHQSLLKHKTQMDLLDRYGGLTQETSSLSKMLQKNYSLKQKLDQLNKTKEESNQKIDFLKFQINEIKTAHLKPGEEDNLYKEKLLFQSAEARVQLANTIHQILETEEDEKSVLSNLKTALQKLKNLNSLDTQTQPFFVILQQITIETEELVSSIGQYIQNIELNSEKLQTTQERLSLIADLRKKYGQNTVEILNKLAVIEKELEDINSYEEHLQQLQLQYDKDQVEFQQKRELLFKKRSHFSDTLSKSITDELKDLRMEHSLFHIKVDNSGPMDSIDFLIQTHPGEPLRSIQKIASGGELSRIMLAIRKVIANTTESGVFLFDEIDAGIGGHTAFSVGRKLKSVSKYHQIICITHLAQIACFADQHLIVKKTIENQETLTQVSVLSEKARIEEIARMLGGIQLTQTNLDNAKELLHQGEGSLSL